MYSMKLRVDPWNQAFRWSKQYLSNGLRYRLRVGFRHFDVEELRRVVKAEIVRESTADDTERL